MTYFTTESVPLNLYGDTREMLVIHDWQDSYAQYLNENGLTLDQHGNPVKKDENDV